MLTRLVKRKVLACLMPAFALAVGCIFTPPILAESVTVNGKTYHIAKPGESVPGEVVVQLKDGFSAAAADAVAARLGGRIAGQIPEYNLFLIKLGGGKSASQALRAAKQEPAVKDAFPNTSFSIPKPVILPSPQKSMNRSGTGADVNSEEPASQAGAVPLAAPTGGQWHLNMINWYDAGAPPATTGIVAVVDTGVDIPTPTL